MTLDDKASHIRFFVVVEIYKWTESWINKLLLRQENIWESEGTKNLHIDKITFKVVQIKSLEMHVTNQKLSFHIFRLGNLQNIFMEHDLYLIS